MSRKPVSEDEQDPTPTSNHLFPEFAITDGVGLRGKHPGEGGSEPAGEVLNSSCWCARALSPPRRVALSLEEREVVGGDRGGKLLAINSKYEWELCFEWAYLISAVWCRSQARGVLHLLRSLVLVCFTVPGTNVPCFFRIPALVQCCK